jgi:hypothetical protein
MANFTLEQLFRAVLRGPIQTKATSAAGQWAGLTTLSSGSATVVISTSNVNSNSIILLSQQGNANIGSGTSIHGFEVKTISSGGYFTLGTADGIAHPRDTTLMWVLFKTS